MLFKNIRRRMKINNAISQAIKDMEAWDIDKELGSDKYKNLAWHDLDGWRGMMYSEDNKKFYFNDYPVDSFTEHLDVLFRMEGDVRKISNLS